MSLEGAMVLSEPLRAGPLSEGRQTADPVATASLYCSGYLDEVIYSVVRPVWRDLREHCPEPGCRLWLLRYGRGGEHLKVRLHGPERIRPLFETLLEHTAQAYFTRPAASTERVTRAKWKSSPPIDEEDRTQEDHPDRILLWTTYHRSSVCLGGSLFLEDSHYVGLMTAALACGCEAMLTALDTSVTEGFTPSLRRSTLLGCLLAGTAGLDLGEDERTSYLAYHRDWLLRSASLQSRNRPGELLDRLDGQIDRSGAPLEPLRKRALGQWLEEKTTEPGPETPQVSLRRAVADLASYVRPFRGDPDYQMDPFSCNPIFTAGFKVLHGIANQLGLDLLNEALTYQLVLRATAKGHPALSRVELTPESAGGDPIR